MLTEQAIKSIISTLTKVQWDAFNGDLKKEILAVDGAVETRLELAALKSEKDALAAKSAELEKQLAAAVKPAEAPATVKPAEAPAAVAPVKTFTADEVAKMVEDKVNAAMGKTAAKGVATDGSKTTDMPGTPAVRIKMLATPDAAGKELDDETVVKRLTGAFFMAGKEGREQIAKLVAELGGQA